jgi:hypothetical protein
VQPQIFVESKKENYIENKSGKQSAWCKKMRLACEQGKTNKLHHPNFSILVAASQNHE